MYIDAKLIKVYPTVSGGEIGKEFKYVPIIIEWEDPLYTRDGRQNFTTDRLLVHVLGPMAGNFSIPVGAEITVDIRPKIREYNDKVFNSINTTYISLRSLPK